MTAAKCLIDDLEKAISDIRVIAPKTSEPYRLLDIAVAIEDAIDGYLAKDPETCAEVAKDYSRLCIYEWPNAAAEVGYWKHAGSYFDSPTGGNYDLWQSPTDEHTQIQVGVANGKEYVCARHTKRRISRPLPGLPDEIAEAYA